MHTIYHYSVFAAAPGGGKHVAIVEGVDNPVDMGTTVAQSGAPLTGFILTSGENHAEVQFFSSPRQGEAREKGSSDSGALVLAEHLRRRGTIQDRLAVEMGEEGLEVLREEDRWWSQQEDTWEYRLELDIPALAAVLDLDWQDIDWHKDIGVAGNSKLNIIVSVGFPDEINPDLQAIAEINRSTKTNGILAFTGPARRVKDWIYTDGETIIVREEELSQPIELRFFAPNKGIPEDNAGSYTLASLAGYLAWFWEGPQEYEVLRGMAMGKPSRLWLRYQSDGRKAINVCVGGQVEMLEVTKWA